MRKVEERIGLNKKYSDVRKDNTNPGSIRRGKFRGTLNSPIEKKV